MLNCAATCRGRDKKPADNKRDENFASARVISELLNQNLEGGLDPIFSMNNYAENHTETTAKEEEKENQMSLFDLAEYLVGEP